MTVTVPGLETLTARGMKFAALFLIFLVPYSIGSVSANYTYVALPFAYVLLRGSFPRPPQLVVIMMAIFTVVLVLAWISQPWLFDLGSRRLGSFILFMTIFTYAFLRIDPEMVNAFKSAVVVISALFSLWAGRTLIVATQRGLDLKGAVGSQRYGFV